MTACETNITCIAQVTLKFVNKALLVHNRWLSFSQFEVSFNLLADKYRLYRCLNLLRAATKDQLFTFNDQLYEQTDGVAMGSPLGPLLANAFMCSIEETLERDGNMPTYYKRFVDNTLTIMPNKTSADNFLNILNQCHSSIKFTMETESNSMLPFLGTQLLNKHTHVETKVYVNRQIQASFYTIRAM